MTVVALPPFMAADFARLDALLARVVLAMRIRRALTEQEFRGMLVSDAQIDAALTGQGRPPPDTAPPREPVAIGPPTRWDDLCRRLGLGAAERDVLLLGVANQLDRRYEAVFAYLNDAMALRGPTVDLALRIFEGLPGVVEALAPGGRLARLGAIETSAAAPPAPWRAQNFLASDLVALNLLGSAPDGLVEALVPAEPGAYPPDCAARVAACTTAPLVHVTGAVAEVRMAVAAGLMTGLGLKPMVCGAEGSDTGAPPRRIALAARLWPIGVVLPGSAPSLVAEALRHWPAEVPLAVAGGRLPAEPGRPVLAIVAEGLSAEAAARCWRGASGCADTTARMLARGFDFGPTQIGRIAESAALAGGGEPALVAAARAERVVDFGPLAQPLPRHRRWEDLVLPGPTARALEDVAIAVERRREVLIGWGFEAERGGGALSVLFTGPSGTGKTMAAGALAGRTGLNLYRIDLSAVVDKYIGETEKNLERIFDAAAGSDSILLFDEADALFGKRAETRDARDRYANLEVSYLLQRIESLSPGMVVVLTTNLAKNMDQAFARRLTHVVDFPRPTPALRRRMWAAIFPSGTPVEKGLAFDRLAEDFDLTGGEIRQVALDAAFRAAGREGAVAAPDLAAALRRHYEKLGRSAPERSLAALTRPAERRIAAE